MININGNVFRGDVKIAYGRFVNGLKNSQIHNNYQEFDQIKQEDATGIETIIIDSPVVDINVSVSDSSFVTSHFYGKANLEGNVFFDIQTLGTQLMVILHINGNVFSKNLKLDIVIPKKSLEVISVRTQSADITLNKGIFSKYLKVGTHSGSLESFLNTSNVNVYTMSGCVELHIDATQDINVDIFTISGDILAVLNNIEHLIIHSNAKNGDIKNSHEGSGYNAYMRINTITGFLRIH